MKTSLKWLFFTALFIFMNQQVQGQRLLKKLQDKVQERVEEKVEERAERRVDQAIDNQLDKLEKSLEKEDTGGEAESDADSDARRQARLQNIMKGIGISGEPVAVADSYSFDHLIQMHIESYDSKGKLESEGEFITHLNPQSRSMGYQMISGNIGQPGQGMFIIDAENGATIILNEENGEKTGFVYGLGTFFSTIGETYQEEEIPETQENYLLNPNVKKTGRTKNIAGYKCEEYTFNDEETESEIWITTDLKMNTHDFFSTLFKTSLYSQGIPWGYMMEATTRDKDSGEKSIMLVTRVDQNSNTRFVLAEYKVTNLGSFQVQAEEE
jgi:hypothetical protein